MILLRYHICCSINSRSCTTSDVFIAVGSFTGDISDCTTVHAQTKLTNSSHLCCDKQKNVAIVSARTILCLKKGIVHNNKPLNMYIHLLNFKFVCIFIVWSQKEKLHRKERYIHEQVKSFNKTRMYVHACYLYAFLNTESSFFMSF